MPSSSVSSPRVAEAWARAQATLEQSLQAGDATAFSVSVRLGGRAAGRLLLGHAHRYDEGTELFGDVVARPAPEALTEQHVFDWASLTKVMAGQALLMQLVAAGKASLAAPVAELEPALAVPRTLSVDHLLAYCSGLPAWRPLYAMAEPARPQATQLLALLGQVPFEAAPGHRRLYSDLGHILLGHLLSKWLGQSLLAAFAQRIAQPLGLARTAYVPALTLAAPAVATGHSNVYERRMVAEKDFGLPAADKGFGAQGWPWQRFRRGTIKGEVADGNAHYLLGGVSAHAGLFGPSDDLALLAEALVVPSARARALGLTPALQEQFITPDAAGRLRSWWPAHELGLADVAVPAPGRPAQAVLMRGFTGTFVYVEPARSLTVAILGNREHGRQAGQYKNLRPVFAAVVAAFRGV